MDDHPVIRSFATAVAVIAATSAFFAAPILPYAHTGLVASFGLSLGVGSGVSWLAIRGIISKPWEWFSVAAIIIGLVGLMWQITSAQTHYQANKARCANIQREMLLPEPRRTDGPDLFQALNCQPHGTDDVQFRTLKTVVPAQTLQPSALDTESKLKLSKQGT